MLAELANLYKDVIIDHAKNPKNFKKLEDANRNAEGFNPLCGDHVQLYLKVNADNLIEEITFQGRGCAISIASASLLTEVLKKKNLEEAQNIFNNFHDLLTAKISKEEQLKLGKLNVFSGVREFPTRIKCASLAWHTLKSAIDNKSENQNLTITTE